MSSSDPSRHVNSLLRTMRGEQFRHSQNVRKDRTHLSSSHTYNSPTLPFSLTWPPATEPETEVESPSATVLPDTSDVLKVTQTRRADVLSVIFSRLSSRSNSTCNNKISSQGSLTPSLTLLCLRLLLSSYSGPDFANDVVPSLPPHLRRDMLRYTAVYYPLSNSKLYALCDPEGHVDGELIIVGPQATLRADHFRKIALSCGYGRNQGTGDGGLEPLLTLTDTNTEVEWDASQSSPMPLQTFILVSCHISTPTLFTLPPTLTSLALVNLPYPVPLHRLPGICPLLSILDLSFNRWLMTRGTNAQVGHPLDRIGWSRWNKLRVLALRGCHPSVAIVETVNRGRWTDVEIIQ